MPTKTQHLSPGRTGWTTLIALAVLSVIAGIWPITGTATTWVPELAVPAAIGLPFLIPPLRLDPLGGTTWAFWASDTVAVVVMLVTAWVRVRAANAKRPSPRAGRAFGRGVWTTVVAVIAANIVRGVFLSFVTHQGLGTYAAMLVGGVLVSALEGALLGIAVGLATLVASLVGPRPAPLAEDLTPPDSFDDHPTFATDADPDSIAPGDTASPDHADRAEPPEASPMPPLPERAGAGGATAPPAPDVMFEEAFRPPRPPARSSGDAAAWSRPSGPRHAA